MVAQIVRVSKGLDLGKTNTERQTDRDRDRDRDRDKRGRETKASNSSRW